MGWVRQGGGRYYVRSVRRGRRVQHEYYGCGPEAVLAAALDAERRRRRQAERIAHSRFSATWSAADEPLVRLVRLTDLLARAVLLVGGYHQHRGGEWRKTRGCRA